MKLKERTDARDKKYPFNVKSVAIVSSDWNRDTESSRFSNARHGQRVTEATEYSTFSSLNRPSPLVYTRARAETRYGTKGERGCWNSSLESFGPCPQHDHVSHFLSTDTFTVIYTTDECSKTLQSGEIDRSRARARVKLPPMSNVRLIA